MKLRNSFKTGLHKLIVPLFKDPKLFSNNISIPLATYTTAEGNSKPALVKYILKELWPEEIRSDFFDIFEKFENLLIAIGQRDHFLHQFHVVLLGLNVIKLLNFKSEREGKKLGFSDISDINEIIGIWILASSTHDFGRPIAEIKKLNDKMSKLFEVFGIKSISQFYAYAAKDPELKDDDAFNRICVQSPMARNYSQEYVVLHNLLVEQISRTLCIELKVAENIVKERRSQIAHGYLGAIILARNVIQHGLNSNNYNWSSFKSSALFRMLLHAMVAVFFHDMNETDWWRNLTPENNLIAFLLCITDQFQEWDRSTRQEEAWPECDLEDVILDDEEGHIRLIHHLHHKGWKDEVKENIRKAFNGKRNALQKLDSTNPSLGLRFTLEYNSDCDEIKEEISIKC